MDIDESKALEQERQKRKLLVSLENQYLSIKLERLKLLKQHYEDYWLDLDLKHSEARLDYTVSAAAAIVAQCNKKALEEAKANYEKELVELNKRIKENQIQLDKFNSLDPELLAEYRQLRDDIDCQNMLFEISKNNVKH